MTTPTATKPADPLALLRTRHYVALLVPAAILGMPATALATIRNGKKHKNSSHPCKLKLSGPASTGQQPKPRATAIHDHRTHPLPPPPAAHAGP